MYLKGRCVHERGHKLVLKTATRVGARGRVPLPRLSERGLARRMLYCTRTFVLVFHWRSTTMAQPDMLGITVHDMGAALRFYRLLGLDIAPNTDGEAYVEVITPNGYRISWNTVE